MNKPIMLITGTSRGIGLACAEYFSDKYTIIGIARSPGQYVTEQGSVTNEVFRKYLINKYTPDIFINNAGVGGNVPYYEIIKTNAEAAADLMLGFCDKMNTGHIINMSSWLATVSLNVHNPRGGYGELTYQVAKKLLTNMSKELISRKNGYVKITSIEPQNINTDMVKNIIRPNIIPMSPTYIAEIIDWIINQPPWVNVDSICLSNFKNIGAPGETRTPTPFDNGF